MSKSRTMDLTEGPIMKKLIAFSIPVLLTALMNHTFTIADRIVVGQFAENGTQALAAVGATGILTSLLLSLSSGLNVGVDVTCANRRGARDQKALERCMYSSLVLGALIGILLAAVGFVTARPFLLWMNTPEDIIDDSTLYVWIYCLGIPALVLNGFGGAILRSHGDTKRPMYNLAVAGIVNVVLNLILVVCFKLDVVGVAVATAVSQYVSLFLKIIILFSPKDVYKLKWRKLRMDKVTNQTIIRVGIPCSLNSMGFSIANLLLQSAVNTFGSVAIAGKTASLDISTLILQGINTAHTSCITFVGQCYGAKKYHRVHQAWKKSLQLCLTYVLTAAAVCTLFSGQLLGLFIDDPEAIGVGRELLMINVWGYFLYGIANVSMGCLRGMGRSSLSNTMNFLGIFVPRLLWVTFIFPLYHDITFLYLCNPISWVIIATAQTVYYFYCRKKLLRPEDAMEGG